MTKNESIPATQAIIRLVQGAERIGERWNGIDLRKIMECLYGSADYEESMIYLMDKKIIDGIVEKDGIYYQTWKPSEVNAN